jgi:hypothetical protein
MAVCVGGYTIQAIKQSHDTGHFRRHGGVDPKIVRGTYTHTQKKDCLKKKPKTKIIQLDGEGCQ